MKGLLKKFACLGLTAVLGLSFAACKDEIRPSEPGENGYLHISAVKLGWGVDWLYALEKAFEEEKKINVDIDVVVGNAGLAPLDNELESLSSTTDLFFSRRGWFAEDIYKGSVTAGGKTYDCLYADLTDVWNSVVDEGTDRTVKEKMNALYEWEYNFDGKYYALPWAGGVYGIVRNLDVWNRLNLNDEDVPYTTNQLFALCDRIKGDVAPFIYSLEDEYYTGWSVLFFGQYEGAEKVKSFMDGKDPDGEVSEYVYTYDGQLEAMKVLKTLLDDKNGYQHKRSTSIDFTSMQGQFLRGAAMFCVNGSWLENEMNASASSNRCDIIKTPVISSVVKRLSFGNTLDSAVADAKLAECIRYVDAKDARKTAVMPEGVTENDIRIVSDARHYSYMVGGVDHQSYVPSYSAHVREAKEFLKFMYSDKGMQIYYDTQRGAMLPATPTKEYDSSSVQLTNFRTSVNAAAQEGFVYSRLPKSRYYVLSHTSTCFENGIDPVNALRGDKTPKQVIDANNALLKQKWPSIKQMLGMA